jgi:hypothetical protein
MGSAQDPFDKYDLAGAEANVPVPLNLTEPLDDASDLLARHREIGGQ